MTKREPKNVLLIGLTSIKLGGLEHGNIGNFLIIDPLFKHLRESFPQINIKTSLQLSEGFTKKYKLTILRDKRFWTYKLNTIISSSIDFLIICIYKTLGIFGIENKKILYKSTLLKELVWADIVLDFSGDIFGDNAPFQRFLEGSIKLLFAYYLDKPIIMIASSPGPFEKNYIYKWIGKSILNKVTLILNREPVSSEYLIKIGVNKEKVINTACPSFLFDMEPEDSVKELLSREGIIFEKPSVGIVITGWNMPTPPFDKTPRKKEELIRFIPLIEFFLNQNLQVFLISHSYRLDKSGSVIPGPDSIICEQLFELVENINKKDHLRIIRGTYKPEEMRKIIGSLDFLVSGRLHAAISGLSQGVPTVIIDYGFEPRGHKLLGVSKLMDIEDLFCDPNIQGDMLEKIKKGWQNKSIYKEKINTQIIEVKLLAKKNFDILKLFLEKKEI